MLKAKGQDLSFQLPGVVAGRVEDAEDDDGIAFNAVEELVRNTSRQGWPRWLSRSNSARASSSSFFSSAVGPSPSRRSRSSSS